MSGVGAWPGIAAESGKGAPIALGPGRVKVRVTDDDGNVTEFERPVEVLHQGRVYRYDETSEKYTFTGVTQD